MARVARRYGINANQLFHWWRLYREGHLGGEPRPEMKLLPVTIKKTSPMSHQGRERSGSIPNRETLVISG